ncbi:cleavage and polyadenylation-specificity factor subunit [Plakobranchus ocellatus]|uniref:Nucleoporin NUP42 n=1 Tax=Plakobranchus ocellatus TaxID=259542 RepID=A0AAV4CIV8_9GAST|nr:cleavage and polyadenylation-specificity factor subunit [Plakobranchus ocellatus]
MSVPVCRFYELKQTCRFGKNCRFSHTLNQRPPPLAENLSDAKHGIIAHKRSNSQHSSTSAVNFDSEENLHHNDVTVIKNFTEASQSSINSTQQGNKHDRSENSHEKPICPYFSRGWCRYGRSCKLSHVASRRGQSQAQSAKYIPPRFRKFGKDSSPTKITSGRVTTPQGDDDRLKDHSSQGSTIDVKHPYPGKTQPKQKGRICSYFKAGQCKRGTYCKFSHDIPQTDIHNESEKSSAGNSAENEFLKYAEKRQLSENEQKANFRPPNSRQVFTLTELEEIGGDKMRNGEIEAIKRRFPKDKIVHVNDGDNFIATIKFSPTDPDWPFDVKEFVIEVVVPPAYPKKTLKVTLPLDQDLPDTVRSYVESSIQEWIKDRETKLNQSGKVELLFRPFLRWLDRTIEEITTEALMQLKRELSARALGIEFISAKKLQERFRAANISSRDNENDPKESDNDEVASDDLQDEEEEDSSCSEEDEEDDEEYQTQTLELQPQQRGTEISLKHLQLKENAAALLFQRLKVILQCGRCKGHTDLYVTQGNVTSLTCDRCNNDMYVTYRPGMLHQFSSVVGYLDVDGCQAFDLILQDCRACVSCMACNKQTTLDGLVTGQLIDGWCKACNAKFKIATEAVKLTQLAPSGVDTSSGPVVKAVNLKSKKPPKDPSIREGYPLPEFGTCKHYKHSYRWLRFPCCGKAYPCDVCHDRKEDHEMTFANRMICGHCCKEQNYSGTRPCSGCGEHMTKVRSAHWEGEAIGLWMIRQLKTRLITTSLSTSGSSSDVNSGPGSQTERISCCRHPNLAKIETSSSATCSVIMFLGGQASTQRVATSIRFE